MMGHFNYNGKFYKENIPIIGASNRGLRYGYGLFETFKCINGELVLLDEHFARLWKGMNLLQFEIPRHLTPGKLQDEIILLTKKNGHNKGARIRLSIIAGNGGLYDADSYFPDYIIETWVLGDDQKANLNSNGLVLGVYKEVKKCRDILSNLKHNNYLPQVLAALQAKKQKWNDAVILNSEGRICESTIANIFLIKNGKVFTPSLEEGCVAGIIRKKIIQQLSSGIWKPEETQLQLEDLFNADEIFLSNSINEIRWVKSVGDFTYVNTVTQQIYKSFQPVIY